MLLVATLSLDPATVPAQRRTHTARRAIATVTRLARLHELVIVADWPDRGWTVGSLVDALTTALPWHEVVLVAARTDTHGRHAGGIANVPTVRRLVEDGAVVICLAGGPGRDRTEPVALALALALHADRVVRLTGDDASTVPDRHHDVQVMRFPSPPRRRARQPKLPAPAGSAVATTRRPPPASAVGTPRVANPPVGSAPAT